jgi:hypothetical protein
MPRLRWLSMMAAVVVAMSPVALMGQEPAGRPGPIAIGVGVERFGVVFNRLADAGSGLISNEHGLTMPSLMATVPISGTFAVQTTVSRSRRTDIAGEHDDLLYGVTINQFLGRSAGRSYHPYIIYGLVGAFSTRVVPDTPEWYYNGSTWEERTRPSHTIRNHTWPSRPVGGAGIQYDLWRGIAVRAEAELIGPSAARVRTNVMIPLGRLR